MNTILVIVCLMLLAQNIANRQNIDDLMRLQQDDYLAIQKLDGRVLSLEREAWTKVE